MELNLLINLIVGALILIIFVYVVMAQIIKKMALDLEKSWRKLYFKLTQRADKIPLILEKLFVVYGHETFNELLDLRQKTRSIEVCNAEKIDLELQLSQKMHEIFENVLSNENLSGDLFLNAAKKDFLKISREIENDLVIYNTKVRKFNSLLKNILVLPLRPFLRLNTKKIFTFQR